MTTYSLGEIEAQCKKAARGAGMAWGMAEEAGKSARWLAAQGLDGPLILANWLNEMPLTGRGALDCEDDVWAARNGVMCPITAGTLVADRAADLAKSPMKLTKVAHPALMLFALQASAAWLNMPLSIRWAGFRARLAPQHAPVWSGDTRAPNAALITCMVDDAQPADAVVEPIWFPQRISLNPDSWSALETLAARTYVPASAASRAVGAGAGLSDND